jgi:hypothetical protein
MTNPFDWKNQPAKISMRDLNIANRNSYQQSVVINNRRAQGIEPSLPYSPKSNDAEPKKFAVAMPVMPVHASTVRARKKKGESK